MGFAEAEQWWEAWQLCLLVLGSLLLQLFLMVAPALHRCRILPWFRFVTLAAYQGSNKQQLHLEVLWAPILLLHLDRLDGITAYSIHDSMYKIDIT